MFVSSSFIVVVSLKRYGNSYVLFRFSDCLLSSNQMFLNVNQSVPRECISFCSVIDICMFCSFSYSMSTGIFPRYSCLRFKTDVCLFVFPFFKILLSVGIFDISQLVYIVNSFSILFISSFAKYLFLSTYLMILSNLLILDSVSSVSSLIAKLSFSVTFRILH